MASEFTEVCLQELAAPIPNATAAGPFGSNLVSRDYVPSGVPVIRGQNLMARWVSGEFVYVSQEKAQALRTNTARPGDVVFTQRGTLGQVALVPPIPFDRYVISQSQMKLSVDPTKVDARFVYYACRTEQFIKSVHDNAVAAGVPHINLGTLRRLEIPCPSHAAQVEIANVLSSLDDRIDHNRALAANLEAIARALFKSWFVDFDPVRAKAAGEAPPGLTPDLAALFPDRFVDSDLGETPEGWNAATLADVCSLNPEAWTTRKHPDNVEYVDLANAKAGEIENRASYSWDESPSRARRVLRPGDTIVGTVRPGNRSFALIAEDGLTGSTGFAALRPNFDWLREFVYLAATSDDAIDRLTHLADGAAYPAVRPDVVVATEAVIPSEDVAKEFSAILRPLIARVAASRSESAALTQLRDLLLPRLISGKLRVDDAEAALEAA